MKSATILLVEDDPFMLAGLHDLLEDGNIGYDLQVLTAENGKVGLQVMSTQLPDLIVSDINMPQMDGNQFLDSVRQRKEWWHIPVIFLTAKGNESDIHHAKKRGVDRYITKPFDSETLKKLVKSQLKRTFDKREIRKKNIETLNSEILRTLNHEFNTPLTYVSAYSEMLGDGIRTYEDGGMLQEYVRGIQAGCHRLTRLVNDFIRVIELRTGETQNLIHQESKPIYDLLPIIQEAILQHTPSEIEISLAPTETLPTIYGHPQSLVSIFDRLLDNAIKFTKSHNNRGQVNISVGVQDDQFLYVTIQDEGKGFPQYVSSKIFTLFFQYNRENFEQQGAGIGLTIVQELVRLHNGSIKVESQLDQGSTFTVLLPIYKLDNDAQSPLPPQVLLPATVLAVEDDEHLLLGLKELLEIFDNKYHLEVLTASNGEEGLQVLSEYHPDLIISDIMMPKIGGFEFLEKVRQIPELVQIPFIFLTARGDTKDMYDGLARGAEEYIPKPYDSDKLLDLVIVQLDRYFQMQSLMTQSFDNLKDNILALMTTDFSVPLLNVSKYSTELEEQLQIVQDEDELKESLTGIQEGSQKLTQLVKDYLALAELTTGEAEAAYQIRACPIPEIGMVVYEAAQLCVFKLQSSGVVIHCPLNDSLPPVFGVSTLLADSISQLVFISLHHYESFVGENIHLDVVHDDEDIRISICWDHQLDETQMDNLLRILDVEDGAKVDLTRHDLVLKLVQGYVGLHNGRIQLQNPPEGFSFNIHLPIYYSAE
jgi:signal transduction histidine kinase